MDEDAQVARQHGLETAYTEAFTQWADSEDAAIWNSASNDGLTDAERGVAWPTTPRTGAQPRHDPL